MQALLHGIHRFRSQVFVPRRGQFERLARGQKPDALFITCSDSRVDPCLLTQSEPGDLFVLRNAGNIVPPHGLSSGEEATVEYAVEALGVGDVIVCGHSHCGAVQALLAPEKAAGMPSVSAWLQNAETTRQIVLENYRDLSGDRLVSAAVQENVLVQLEHLCTFPSVAARLARGELRLHGWVYKIETGEVFAYDPASEQFLPITPGVDCPSVRTVVRRGETGLQDRLVDATADPVGFHATQV